MADTCKDNGVAMTTEPNSLSEKCGFSYLALNTVVLLLRSCFCEYSKTTISTKIWVKAKQNLRQHEHEDNLKL